MLHNMILWARGFYSSQKVAHQVVLSWEVILVQEREEVAAYTNLSLEALRQKLSSFDVICKVVLTCFREAFDGPGSPEDVNKHLSVVKKSVEQAVCWQYHLSCQNWLPQLVCC